ncbi:MAG: MFS transporter [Acidobacteriota bacterium]
MSQSIETTNPPRRDTARMPERTRISATAGYFVAFVTLGLSAAVMGPTLPALAERTHVRLDEISILFATRSLGYLIGSLVGGHAFDRRRGHPIVALMLLIMAATIALVPVISSLAILALVLLVLGIAESAVDVGCNSLLIWLYRREVGPWMNGLHFAFGAGAFLSPIIVAQVILITGDISWAYWLLALIILPGVFWLPRLDSPVPERSLQEKHTGSTPWGTVVLIACFVLLYVGAEGGFGGWIFTYATTLGLSDAATAAYLTAVFWGALTVGRLLGIPLAARMTPRAVLFWDMALSIVSIGMIALWSGSAMILWVGAVGAGLGMASIYPTMLSFAERRMTITGQITGWIFLGAGAGGMIVPWLIGQLFERMGAWVTMYILLADLGLALVLLAVLAIHRH